MKLSDIYPGLEIEYRGREGKRKTRIRTGTVRQVTARVITVDGPKYPDTILVNDLLSGQTEILKLGEGEDNMPLPKKKAPDKDALLRLWIKHGKIDPIRKELGESWGNVRMWLHQAGIIDQYNNSLVDRSQHKMENLRPSKQTLQNIWTELGTISAVAKRLDVGVATAKQWLVEAEILNSLGQPVELNSDPEPNQELQDYVDQQLDKHAAGQEDLPVICTDCGKEVESNIAKALFPGLYPVPALKIVCLDCYAGYEKIHATPKLEQFLEKFPEEIEPQLSMAPGEELPRERVPYTLAEYNRAVKPVPAPEPSDDGPGDDREGRLKLELIATILYKFNDGAVNADLALKYTRGILDLGNLGVA